jgi:hypothetical protein
MSGSKKPEVAQNAKFHLFCLQLMKGDEQKAQITLEKLANSTVSQQQKEFVAKLKKMVDPHKQQLPEGFNTEISIEVKSIDFHDAIKILAQKANVNIVVHKDVKHKIELKLDNVTVIQAIESLCTAYELDYVLRDNIMTIFPKGRKLALVTSSGKDMPKSFQNRITVDFKNVDVRAILKIIAKMSNTNIVVHKDVRAKTSISFKDATVERALNAVCAVEDLRYEQNDNIFVVMPMGTDREKYVKQEIRLAYLEPEIAAKIVVSNSEKPNEIMVKAKKDSILLEGNSAEVKRLERFIEMQDKKGKAHKVAVRIWKLKEGVDITMRDLTKLQDEQRKKVARIISAPTLISLPGKECKIQVGENSKTGKEEKKDSFSYSFTCIFHETEVPDMLRLICNVKVHGITFVDGKKHEIKREFAPTLQVKRNKRVTIPLSDEKEKLFLDLQISQHVE